MPNGPSSLRRHLTLLLATLLHAFTHIYGSLLVPLYLLMVADLNLPGVGRASLIMTIYGLVYCLGSYAAGVLADRLNRKALLGIGLLGNALAIGLMGLTHRYEMLVALGVLAGVFGALFHPAGAALAPAHYPKHPGLAIGILGAGSGLGFFIGPQFAGWRAQTATWNAGSAIANWQVPCIEMGLIGLLFGILFLVIASEVPHSLSASSRGHVPLGPSMRRRMALIAAILGGRDLAGVALLTLASIYFQKALGMTVMHAGLILGVMMLIGVLANPLAVYLTPGKLRLPGLVLILVVGGLVEVAVPHVTRGWVLPLLVVFEAMQLGCYAVSDAAILERVPAAVRGRIMGLFLTVAGTLASTGPWIMGHWTDQMAHPEDTTSYYWPFALLGALMALSSLSVPLIVRLGPAHAGVVRPLEQIDPATLEAVG